MSDTDASWLEFTAPGLGIRLHYPAAAPDGEHVEMDDFRAHFRTMTSAQVYFEVSRHTGISPRDLYERESAAIRRGDPSVRVSDLSNTSFAGRDARQFSLTFPDKERVFILVESQGHVYRVIYDPRSPVNHEIIATIEFT